MDTPAPILIANAEELEAKQILTYRYQNNRHEFLVHWKGYEQGDESLEPIENLYYSLELIKEYWDANHPAEQTPQTPSTPLKPPGNQGKFSPHPVQQMISQMTSVNHMTRRNMIPAAETRIISPQKTKASYGTLMRALRKGRTLE